MVTSFLLIAADGRPIGEAGSIDAAIKLVRAVAPGRYRLQETTIDFATGDARSFEWGAIIKRHDGGVEVEPPPRFD